jgi:SAM-dependent methyltransferase
MIRGVDNGTCLGCGSKLPSPFLDLGRTPLANSYLSPDQAMIAEPTFPLAVAYCGACHLAQLNERVPPTELFTEYAYFSSYSDSFANHSERMAVNLKERFGLSSQSRVVEIASNDGYLLRYFRELGMQVLGVEPARNIAAVARSRGIPTVEEFFNSVTADAIVRRDGLADLIIGNNVLAHVPTINDFLQAVATLMKPKGAAVFEFPYLGELIERGEFDTIYHEHVFYLSLHAVASLVARANLELYDAEVHDVHGGSLRIFMQHPGARERSPALAALMADERHGGLLSPECYQAFGAKIERTKQALLALLYELRNAGKRVAAYGAPAKGNTLINYCGIGPDLIEFTVDRNPYKQGRLLPGSHIPIYRPEELFRRHPDYALILPWNIAGEIVEQQQEYLESGGRFIAAIPEPRIV